MNKSNYLFLIIFLVLPFSCEKGVVYDQFISTGDRGWTWQDKCDFEIDIQDTISLNNLYIQIRHSVDYPMSNLYMFVHVKGPSGQSLTDTVNFILAREDGKWLGSGVGKFRELRLLYRKNTVFKDPGVYSFVLEQGMRNPNLPVTDVGIRIENVNQ